MNKFQEQKGGNPLKSPRSNGQDCSSSASEVLAL